MPIANFPKGFVKLIVVPEVRDPDRLSPLDVLLEEPVEAVEAFELPLVVLSLVARGLNVYGWPLLLEPISRAGSPGGKSLTSFSGLTVTTMLQPGYENSRSWYLGYVLMAIRNLLVRS